MEFLELVRKNRSYRGYNENRPVAREELRKLVECARLCPSSVNAQPLKYRLVWQKEEVARLQEKTNWAKASSASRRTWASWPRPCCWLLWKWAWGAA